MYKQVDMKPSFANHRELRKHFRSKVIPHPIFKDALDAIRDTQDMYGEVGTGMLLLGLPGLGKTTIIEKYIRDVLKEYGITEFDTRSERPVFKVEMPANPTIKGVLDKIIRAMGQEPYSGTQTVMEAQLNEIIANQKVQMIIFDECQHLLREQAQVKTRNVINFIKLLMDINKLAVVMAGTPDAASTIVKHEELDQRFTYRQVDLHPFSVNEKKDRETFSAYLNANRRILIDVGVNIIDLTSDHMLARMVLATMGRPRLINRLLDRAIQLADLSKTINMPDFEQAYAKTQLNKELGKFNPFSAPPKQVFAKLETLQAKGVL